MKLRTYLGLFLMLATFGLTAQETPIAEITLKGGGKNVSFHDYSGVPIIQTNETYTGINPITHEVIWEMQRNKTTAALESMGTDVKSDFVDIYTTPFAYMNGSVINVLTGEVLIDGETDAIKSFSTFYIVPEADLVLVELFAKGSVRLYGLDPFTASKKWGVQLREMSGVGQAMASADTDSAPPYVIPPLLTAAGNLLYHNGKYLASIDLSNGSLQWNNKINPGYIFLNDDATKLLVAEKRGGLGGAMSMSATGGSPNKFSKILYLLDANSGESLWSKGDTKMGGNIKFIMPYDGGYAVVHDEGFNIFDYNEGKEAEGRWKKDYSEKGIKDIVIEEEGLMLYFKNRRMLIDPATGDDLWKKTEKLEREPPAYMMSRASQPIEVGNISYIITGNKISVTANGRTRSYLQSSYTVDEAGGQLVIAEPAYSEDTNTESRYFRAIAVDINTGKTTNNGFNLRKGVTGVDAIDGGYFFYNDRNYIIMKYANNEWTKGKTEYYPDPSRGERFLKGFVSGVVLTGAGAANGLAGTSAVVSNNAGAYNSYQNRMSAIDAGNDATNAMVARQINGRVEQNYAYFFATNDSNKTVLFKVDKNTGEEVKEFPFNDNTPIYEIDTYNNQLYFVKDETLSIFDL